MKKQILALLLALCALLCACSSDSEEKKDANVSNTLNTEASTEIGEKGEIILEGAKAKVLFENDSCSVTLQKAEIDGIGDYFWNVTLLNKSTSTQTFTVDNVFVNDFGFDPAWAVSVPAGSTVEERITWTAPELELRGITQVTRVDLNLRVLGDDETEFANTDITYYPSNKGAHIAQERKQQTTDAALLKDDKYSVIVTNYDSEHRWGCVMDLYLQNLTDKTVTFTVKNVLVGGYDCDPQWHCTLPAGKQTISQMMWFEEQLEEIGDITGFMFDLEITDESGNVLFSESRTYVP